MAGVGQGYIWEGTQYPSLQALQNAIATKNNPPGGAKAATQAAQQSVMGNPMQGLQGGGPGSSYTVDPLGRASYTVTPDTSQQETEAEASRFARQQEADVAQFERQRTASSQDSAAQFDRQNAADIAQFERQKAADAAQFESQKAAASQDLQQRAQIQAEAEQRRVQTLGGSFPPVSQVQYGGSTSTGQEGEARALAFTRGREQAGQTAQASLAALQGLMDERGLTGSTVEGSLSGQVLRGAGADVNRITQEQLLQDLAREAQIQDIMYQGGITQRGQDLNQRQALLQLMTAPALY